MAPNVVAAGRRTYLKPSFTGKLHSAGSQGNAIQPRHAGMPFTPHRLSHLEVLTKALDVAVCDEAGGEAEEGFVDVVSSLAADA